jgi:hypothetical protein
MADYSGAYEGNCPMRCSILSGHSRKCPSHPDYDRVKWADENGFRPVFTVSDTGRDLQIMHYACERGCGTLVWDPQAHIKNVCVTWKDL